VESPLSVSLLKGDFMAGDRVRVDVGEDNELTFSRLEPATPPEEPSLSQEEMSTAA
jgi:hypothetical protein